MMTPAARRVLAALGLVAILGATLLVALLDRAEAVLETTKETITIPVDAAGTKEATYDFSLTGPEGVMPPGQDTLGVEGHWEVVSPDGGSLIQKVFVASVLDTALSVFTPIQVRLTNGNGDTLRVWSAGIFSHTQPPDSASAFLYTQVEVRNTNPLAVVRYVGHIWTK